MRSICIALALAVFSLGCTTSPPSSAAQVVNIQGSALIVAPGGDPRPLARGDRLLPGVYFRGQDAEDSVRVLHAGAQMEVSGIVAVEERASQAHCRSSVALRPISGSIRYLGGASSKPSCASFRVSQQTLIPNANSHLSFSFVDGFTVGLLHSGHATLAGDIKGGTLAAGDFFLINAKGNWMKHSDQATVAEVIQHELRSLDGYRASLLHQELNALVTKANLPSS